MRNEIILGCLVISHNLEAFDLVLRLGSDYRDMAEEKTDKQIQNEIRRRDYKVKISWKQAKKNCFFRQQQKMA